MAFSLHLVSLPLAHTSIELYVPDAEEIRVQFEKGEISFPYWSQVWPAAQALGLYLEANPDLVKNKKVLELAAGLGLPSLVAAPFARSITCSDYDSEAVSAIRLNAAHHGFQHVEAAQIDWNQLPAGLDPEVLLLSDINYEPAAFATLQQLILHFLRKGTTIVLSTPQRLVAKDFLLPLMPYVNAQEEYTHQHRGAEVHTMVFVLQP